MFAPVLVVLVVTSLGAGCGRKPSNDIPNSPASTEVSDVTHPDSQAMDQVLAELTQTVRKYAMEKQTVPRSLDELVAAGYLRGLPALPAGKTFGISKDLKVHLR